MALLNKLKQVRSVKENYKALQHSFYDELFARYPNIFGADIAEIANKLQEELHTMLCVALKYSSVKIQLTARPRYHNSDDKNTIVNVQRGEPGFYYPQSQRGASDINYFNFYYYINDKDDMWYKNEEEETDYGSKKTKVVKRDHMMVQLSDLRKNAPRVNAEKLAAYFAILREVMAYKSKFLCYTGSGFGAGEGRTFEIGDKIKFAIHEKSFDVMIKGKRTRHDDDDEYCSSNYHSHEECGFRYQPGENDMTRILDYSDQSHKHFGDTMHKKLRLFIENYNEIRDRLIEEEAKKKLAVDNCKAFIEQLRVHTVPFHVLNQIKK